MNLHLIKNIKNEELYVVISSKMFDMGLTNHLGGDWV